MDDRQLEQRLEGLQKGIADIGNKIEKSFRWSIITVAVGIIITWFGIFLLIARGTSFARKSLTG